MRSEDLDSTLALCSASVTGNKVVSVEWPLLNPDWLLSSKLLCERKEDTRLNTTRSSDFAMNGRRKTVCSSQQVKCLEVSVF